MCGLPSKMKSSSHKTWQTSLLFLKPLQIQNLKRKKWVDMVYYTPLVWKTGRGTSPVSPTKLRPWFWSVGLILAMTVCLPIWHFHYKRVRFTVLVSEWWAWWACSSLNSWFPTWGWRTASVQFSYRASTVCKRCRNSWHCFCTSICVASRTNWKR